MNTLSKRDKLIGVAIATVLVCGGLWYFLIRAQKATVATLKAKIEAAGKKVTDAKRLVDQESDIQDHFGQLTRQLRAVEEGMAKGDLYSWGVTNLTTFAMNRRVSLPEVTKPAEGEVGLLASFPYKAAIFTVRGSAYYHDFGTFLADFENAQPYMRVQNLEIEPLGTAAAGQEEKLQFKLDVVALIKPITSR